MAVPPDRGVLDLDLRDGKTPLKLWYPLGALKRLLAHLGSDLPMHELGKLTQLCTVQHVTTFIWAGRLWEDRDTKLEPLAERIDWCPVPPVNLAQTLQTHLAANLYDEELAREADPRKNAGAGDGAGEMPSASPTES